MNFNKNIYYLRNLHNKGLDEFGKLILLNRGVYSSLEKNENPKFEFVMSVHGYYRKLNPNLSLDMLIYDDLESEGFKLDLPLKSNVKRESRKKDIASKIVDIKSELEQLYEYEFLKQLKEKKLDHP